MSKTSEVSWLRELGDLECDDDVGGRKVSSEVSFKTLFISLFYALGVLEWCDDILFVSDKYLFLY